MGLTTELKNAKQVNKKPTGESWSATWSTRLHNASGSQQIAKAMTEYESTLNALSPLFLVFPLSLLPTPTLVLIDLKISKNVTENTITATKTYGVTIT